MAAAPLCLRARLAHLPTETNLEPATSRRYRIDVIDLQDPALAREHGIVAVPMLVREAPVPIRKVVGDLSDTKRALAALT